MQLSNRDARRLFVNQQGLFRMDQFGRGKNAVLRSVRQLGYVQIDTISVVNRAHEHVLANRVSNFGPAMLESLLESRLIFEYWGHAAAYLPFEHYRYSIPVMKGWRASRTWDTKLAQEILTRIRREGPLQSRDFEDNRKNRKSGWWDWKPAKQVLDCLFLAGELMVSRREGFRKVFDLPEKVIPGHVDTSEPSRDEWALFIAESMSRALGVATEDDLAYSLSTIRRLSKVYLRPALKGAINRLVEEGTLTAAKVAGADHFVRTDLLNKLPLRLVKRELRTLSPFDNLVINRKRLSRLFGFDYQLECYLPESKRQYGYFALPVLWGDQLVGRLDAKADRKRKHLVIKNLVLEPQCRVTDELHAGLVTGIRTLGASNHCETVTIEGAKPADLAGTLARDLEEPPG